MRLSVHEAVSMRRCGHVEVKGCVDGCVPGGSTTPPGVTVSPAANVVKWRAAGAGGGGWCPMRLYEEQGNI